MLRSGSSLCTRATRDHGSKACPDRGGAFALLRVDRTHSTMSFNFLSAGHSVLRQRHSRKQTVARCFTQCGRLYLEVFPVLDSTGRDVQEVAEPCVRSSGFHFSKLAVFQDRWSQARELSKKRRKRAGAAARCLACPALLALPRFDAVEPGPGSICWELVEALAASG